MAAAALIQHPQVNASFQDKVVRYYEHADIGVAVAIEDGLITPIVRSADQKSLSEIAAEVRDLAGRARNRKLRPEEFLGATFSISNLGMFGIEEFTAVINPPEGAILAVGAMSPKPVVRDNEIVDPPDDARDDVLRSSCYRRRHRREVSADLQEDPREPAFPDRLSRRQAFCQRIAESN